ncbi:MAG: uncharacterized protein QOD72_1547 [Acidimicrobiaceae bacterium]|nr:uncharacterized protein [Acidimicrobiaceae bacterium]
MERLSLAAARRIALAAQGFADPRPSGRIDARHGRRLFEQINVIQIDSVNVFVRSQELPVFARLGAHRRDLLSRMVDEGKLFEYWGHMASFIPVEHHRLLRWRMQEVFHGGAWGGLVSMVQERPGYVEAVLEEVRVHGPMSAGELSDPGTKSGPWWGWKDGKRALELLFWAGLVTARRRNNFERVYDLPERVLPPEVLAAPTPTKADAQRELLALSAVSLGVATAADLADYYRINVTKARPLIAELVEDGRLVPVHVEGWNQPTYLHPDVRRPRRVERQAVLSPFDSLVWARQRTERLFDFHYRIEIYTPAPKRIFGYYVCPFLFDERIAARVDLKADRAAGTLRAPAVYSEPGVDRHEVAHALAGELRAVAGWLGLDQVSVGEQGDLASPLRRALAYRRTATSA